MLIKACLVPFIVAALTIAAPNKPICGYITDSLDVNQRCKATGAPSKFEPVLLNDSKWIWTGENPVPQSPNPAGTRPFRKSITTPCGKCATCATIILASDDKHTVYVNGMAMGTGAGWTNAQVVFAPLKPSENLIAIEGINTGSYAALIATINVHYSDGTHDTFVTDETWKTLKSSPPQGFELSSTSDESWPPAVFQGTPQQSMWGNPRLPPVLPLAPSKWIWTSDNVGTVAPQGSRAFRKTIEDCDKVAVCATVLISADNHYALYVNGQIVGNGDSFSAADAFSIPNLHPTRNTFAINATNDAGPAGVIATIHITYSDGTDATIVTDGSWKASKTVPNGFQETSFDDSTWEAATVVGNYGIAPWGSGLTVPAA